ncbi:hypothetical protein [Candidatus Poriferisodalis sp.]|uniref:hypothetical protein n=1 Tax=Candidatus Poriferisodalis sp. TaxID=3101277 RepID=UPI003AF69E23
MSVTLALSVGVPVALALACWRCRRRWPALAADIRGIALQTVIVIVVMLVIAGGVAGVLLSRGGDVIADLEGQDVGSVTAANCTTLMDNGIAGVLTPTNGIGCTWTGTTADPLSAGTCRIWGGQFFATGIAAGALDGSTALTSTSNVGGQCQVTF